MQLLKIERRNIVKRWGRPVQICIQGNAYGWERSDREKTYQVATSNKSVVYSHPSYPLVPRKGLWR